MSTLNDNKAFPNKVIRRCPAIKLAVSRTHNVIGRINLLVISMITINLIKTTGVPWGTKWDNMWLRFFNQPNRLTVSHLTNAKGRVKTKWEVKENTCGKRAVKFIKKIKMNKIRIEASSLFFVLFRLKDTSFNKNLENFLILFKCEGVENHKCWGIIKIINKPVNQHKLRDDEEGSKTENRLFIIVFSFLSYLFSSFF